MVVDHPAAATRAGRSYWQQPQCDPGDWRLCRDLERSRAAAFISRWSAVSLQIGRCRSARALDGMGGNDTCLPQRAFQHHQWRRLPLARSLAHGRRCARHEGGTAEAVVADAGDAEACRRMGIDRGQVRSRGARRPASVRRRVVRAGRLRICIRREASESHPRQHDQGSAGRLPRLYRQRRPAHQVLPAFQELRLLPMPSV